MASQRFLAAFRRIQRKFDCRATGETFRLLVYEMPDLVAEIADERRYADRTARNPKQGLGDRSAADHIHVNVCLDARRIDMLRQIDDAAFDLGRPQETNGP